MSSAITSAVPVTVPAPMELTPAVVQELLEKHRETLLSSLAKMLSTSSSAAPAPVATDDKKGRKKKEKKPVDPNAPPKEKRAPNSWILFSMRVEKLIRAAEEAAGKTTKETRMHTVVIKQFAASLKSTKPYDDWADDEITEALTTWTPPEVSKMSAAKAEKEAATASSAASVASDSASVAPDAADVPVAAAPAAAPAAEKPKRKWSDEAKAAAAEKRAATKAAAKAAAPAADAPAADAPAPAAAEPKKTAAIKPKKAAAPPPAPEKKFDLSLFEWTHDGKDYYTNDRGDVVTTDFEWVGRFDGKSIDETVPEPADLSEATLRQ
jgi:hypothetical protein